MVIAIMGILALMGASFLPPLMNLYFFAPNQMNNEFITNSVLNNIIEGNGRGNGIRILKNITSATDTSITYTDSNGITITLTWNSGTKKITRTISSTTITLPEEISTNSINIDGTTSGVIFKYYDSTNSLISTPVATPANIKRVQMDWLTYSGTGNTKLSQSKYIVSSGEYIKQF